MLTPPRSLLAWVLVAALASQGCAARRQEQLAPCPPWPARCAGVIFAADGAGDFRAASKSLHQVVEEAGLPVQVHTFVWSHGYGRVLSDQVDLAHTRREGQRLAADLMVQCQQNPQRPIYLYGHSAGCGVILAAAELLPPETIERMALLAPSVPADYDVGPALRATRRGIDVYCSPHRDSYLKVAAVLAVLTHGERCWRAGQIGFRTCPQHPEEAQQYSKLRHLPWNPELAVAGHRGGHYGAYQHGYLRSFVLPLLLQN